MPRVDLGEMIDKFLQRGTQYDTPFGGAEVGPNAGNVVRNARIAVLDSETGEVAMPTWDEVFQIGMQAIADGMIQRRQGRR